MTVLSESELEELVRSAIIASFDSPAPGIETIHYDVYSIPEDEVERVTVSVYTNRMIEAGESEQRRLAQWRFIQQASHRDPFRLYALLFRGMQPPAVQAA